MILLLLIACTADKDVETGDTEGQAIIDALFEVDGVTVISTLESPTPDAIHLRVGFEQPVDHDDPGGATFTQYVSLLHRDVGLPVVMDTKGYVDSVSGYDNELSWLLGANRLNVEHRFFGDSVPDEPDWSLLRVEQQNDDLHAIVTALQEVYGEAWISTGASKGGMTALLYRAAWPDDVDGTVAYVAPFSHGYTDPIYASFFETIGTEECRALLLSHQRALLSNADTLVPLLEEAAAGYGEGFTQAGAERAFQVSVAELPWSFWQYDSVCEGLPPEGTSTADLWAWFIDWVGAPWSYSDSSLSYYAPYFYQSAYQLGYPGIPYDDIDDLLDYDPDDITPFIPPGAAMPTFDGAAVTEATDWLSASGDRLMLIYGDLDPWTAGALELDGATDSVSYLSPGENHGAAIVTLPTEDLSDALDIVERWSGVEIDLSRRKGARPPALEAPERAARR